MTKIKYVSRADHEIPEQSHELYDVIGVRSYDSETDTLTYLVKQKDSSPSIYIVIVLSALMLILIAIALIPQTGHMD